MATAQKPEFHVGLSNSHRVYSMLSDAIASILSSHWSIREMIEEEQRF